MKAEDFKEVVCVRETKGDDKEYLAKIKHTRDSEEARKMFAEIEEKQQKWLKEHPGQDLPQAPLTRLIVLDENGKVKYDSIDHLDD